MKDGTGGALAVNPCSLNRHAGSARGELAQAQQTDAFQRADTPEKTDIHDQMSTLTSYSWTPLYRQLINKTSVTFTNGLLISILIVCVGRHGGFAFKPLIPAVNESQRILIMHPVLRWFLVFYRLV